jgi:hypothetical protein
LSKYTNYNNVYCYSHNIYHFILFTI